MAVSNLNQNKGTINMNIKKIVMLWVAAIAISVSALDFVEVIDVAARQRYPWNGLVDIDFELDSRATEPYLMNVTVFDNVGKTNLPVETVYTEGISFKENPCMVHKDTSRIIWDAAADLPNGFKATNVLVTCQDVRAIGVSNLYMIVDLAGGSGASSYPVCYTNCPPSGGWTEEHMTSKLVLRRVEPGSFLMGSHEHYDPDHQANEVQHLVQLTKPYYIGIYEITARQWSYICGGSDTTTKPVSKTWDLIRGFELQQSASAKLSTGTQTYYHVGGDLDATSFNFTVKQSQVDLYPVSDTSKVDPNSLVGKIRAKTGIMFDLPTEAQWERACRAGSSTAINIGESNSSSAASMISGSEKLDPTGDHYLYVGNYMPNAYGLYDMCSSGGEWCLDVYNKDLGTGDAVDPVKSVNVIESVVLYDKNIRGSYAQPYWSDSAVTYTIEGVKSGSKSGYHFLKLTYTAYGVSHTVRGGTSRSAWRTSSGKTINNKGNFYSSGYYGAKGSVKNPSFKIRLVAPAE